MSQKTFVILPVHNRIDITRNFIHLLLKQTYSHYHLILVDDGSTDGTAEMVSQTLPAEKLTIIRGEGNWYWGGSLHHAYKYLNREFKKGDMSGENVIVIMNDDTEFAQDFLERGISLLSKSEKHLLLAQSFSLQEKEKKYRQAAAHMDWKKFIFTDPVVTGEEIQFLTTRGLFLRLKDFITIGGFHPQWIPHYLSDYEFTYRAYRKGYKLSVINELEIYENLKTTRNNESVKKLGFLNKYFNKRSPLYFPAFFYFTLRWCPIKYIFQKIISLTFGIITMRFE